MTQKEKSLEILVGHLALSNQADTIQDSIILSLWITGTIGAADLYELTGNPEYHRQIVGKLRKAGYIVRQKEKKPGSPIRISLSDKGCLYASNLAGDLQKNKKAIGDMFRRAGK
jgi:hypothetical protein